MPETTPEFTCAHFRVYNAEVVIGYPLMFFTLLGIYTMPKTTPEFTRARLRGNRVEVVVHGAQWAKVNARAISIARVV